MGVELNLEGDMSEESCPECGSECGYMHKSGIYIPGCMDTPKPEPATTETLLRQVLDMALDEAWFAYRYKGYGQLRCAMCDCNVSLGEKHDVTCYHGKLEAIDTLVRRAPASESDEEKKLLEQWQKELNYLESINLTTYGRGKLYQLTECLTAIKKAKGL